MATQLMLASLSCMALAAVSATTEDRIDPLLDVAPAGRMRAIRSDASNR